MNSPIVLRKCKYYTLDTSRTNSTTESTKENSLLTQRSNLSCTAWSPFNQSCSRQTLGIKSQLIIPRIVKATFRINLPKKNENKKDQKMYNRQSPKGILLDNYRKEVEVYGKRERFERQLSSRLHIFNT